MKATEFESETPADLTAQNAEGLVELLDRFQRLTETVERLAERVDVLEDSVRARVGPPGPVPPSTQALLEAAKAPVPVLVQIREQVQTASEPQ